MLSFANERNKWNEMSQNANHIPAFIEKVICCYFSKMLTELIQHISSVSCCYRAIVPCSSKDLEKHNVLVWEKCNVSGQTVHLILFGFTKKVAVVFWITKDTHHVSNILLCAHLTICLINSVSRYFMKGTDRYREHITKYFEIYSPLSFRHYSLRMHGHLSSKSFTRFP